MRNKSKYSESFERDYHWYLKMRHQFNFDGHIKRNIEFNITGINGKAAIHKI